MENKDPTDIHFDKLKPMRTGYFNESRQKEGHNVTFEQACAVIQTPGAVYVGDKERIIFAGRLEEGRSPIVAVVSARTSACANTGSPLQVGVVVNAYKNSDKRIIRLLEGTSLSAPLETP